MTGKYRISEKSPFKYLVNLGHNNLFLAAKSDLIYYVIKLKKTTSTDFFNSDLQVEFEIIDAFY